MTVNTSVTQIKCNHKRFFYYWLQFTMPLHKLKNKDMLILSYILKKRHELSRIITDDSAIDKFLFSRDIREQIMEENNLKRIELQQTLTELRKANILSEDNQLNKRIIPKISTNGKKFDLMIIFNIEEDDIK